jgi:hypothetical protein
MAGVTAAASIADALKTQAVVGVVESLFRNNEVMGEFPMIPFTGGSTINIKQHYAGNTSVGVYSEGDAIGVAGSQSYITAQWPEAHYKGVMQITGHARDFTRNGSNEAVFFDQIAMESERIVNDMIHQISIDMLGTGLTSPVGIQGIVDSTGTIAGLSRATYTWFAAYEAASLTSSTAIQVADIDSAMSQSQDQPYAGMVDEIWTSWHQQFKLKGAVGNVGVSNSPVRIISQGPGPQGINVGDVRDQMFVGSVPIKTKRNLDNSIWLGLTKADFFIGKMREFQVDELGKTDDSDKYLVTASFGLGNKNPKRSWKQTGYTQ